jgi:hypothetical protein
MIIISLEKESKMGNSKVVELKKDVTGLDEHSVVMPLDVFDRVNLEIGLCDSLAVLMGQADDDLDSIIVQHMSYILHEKLSKVDALLNNSKGGENPS